MKASQPDVTNHLIAVALDGEPAPEPTRVPFFELCVQERRRLFVREAPSVRKLPDLLLLEQHGQSIEVLGTEPSELEPSGRDIAKWRLYRRVLNSGTRHRGPMILSGLEAGRGGVRA